MFDIVVGWFTFQPEKAIMNPSTTFANPFQRQIKPLRLFALKIFVLFVSPRGAYFWFSWTK
jgi:hypothetical protein